ncbi:exodeoxyribonuclease III, partial [Patescibacteria group bacterium]|nr:exodeoxyribonuclease III [Patescibacteria group bacterium]
MKIISWNINGIRAAEKKGFLTWLAKVSPDIMCLQEIKAMPDQLELKLREPNGYHTYWNPAERKGYSGTAILSKKKPKSIKTNFGSRSILSKEGRLIEADFGDFILLNIYFPNGKMDGRLEYKMKFYDAFLKYANKLKQKRKKIIFCGDINTAHKEIDLFHPKTNQKTSGFLPQERAWLDKVVKHGYLDTLRE